MPTKTTPVLKQSEVDATMREAFDLRVFVVGGGFQYLSMFFDAGIKGARSVKDANIVCFTGGSDVSPSFYGEKALPETNYYPQRDEYEKEVYEEALAAGRPMVGICRGAQFLNVMNKGRLWQHVNNHAIYGGHDVVDLRTGKTKKNMTSTHHQMMIEGPDAEVIAVAALSTFKQNEKVILNRPDPEQDDNEVLWYPESLSLCFQPHPEFKEGECRDYFLELFDDLVMPAT